MRKPTYDPKGFASRLQSLAKEVVLYAQYHKEPFKTSWENSEKRLLEAYRKQNEYIEYLEKKLEHLEQPERFKQPVNLYHVRNGCKTWEGVPYSVIVVATDEQTALSLGEADFKQEAEEDGLGESYYNRCTVKCMEEDIDVSGRVVGWIGE
ncbi:hypothetical protein ABEW81_11240 [Priestia megaterium]